ncbi:hypothetical protein LUZ63_006492 [Rhynchospora breviuscula]|uniref:Uncharacterized protein n=1 Tax=Rhynchospora breviuscula TaxID=2022672 RepID=A0A9Q0HU43_9POAL|nr:hypothetical protein LUZ63_006492 [Rhynchospora breviuscula]
MGRAPCCDKASVKKGPWSPEEDAKLKAYIEENGTGGNWIALPHKIGLKRCGKSCRLRWLNYLRPNIKHGDFTPEEDNIICNLYISIGSRWSIIAAQLPGRTDNDVKNYWNTKLKKRLLGRRRDPSRSQHLQSNNQDQRESSNENDNSTQNLSASALERIQLCMQLQGLPLPLFQPQANPLLWANDAINQNQGQNLSDMLPAEISSNPPVNENGAVSGLDEGLLDGIETFSSPLSGVHSNVNAVEAELRGLLYSEEGQVSKQSYNREEDFGIGSMDWWDNYANKSPTSSWGHLAEPNPISPIPHDYSSLYDI